MKAKIGNMELEGTPSEIRKVASGFKNERKTTNKKSGSSGSSNPYVKKGKYKGQNYYYLINTNINKINVRWVNKLLSELDKTPIGSFQEQDNASVFVPNKTDDPKSTYYRVKVDTKKGVKHISQYALRMIKEYKERKE